MVIWVTGLSGSGKSTIAKAVYKELKKKFPNTVLLDGDIFRYLMGNDLSHNVYDRLVNAERISRFCKILNDQQINVVCATMSLFKQIHQYNRDNIKEYYEVYLDVPIKKLIKRDSKKLYSRALKGETKNVPGIDISYDKPENPHLIIDNSKLNDLDKNVSLIIELIFKG